MSIENERLEALRQAVRIAPADALLRRLLADALLDAGDAPAAEAQIREALRTDGEDVGLRVGLARAFHRQGKASAALVVVEDLLRAGGNGAEVHLLHARILLDAGDVERARQAYREAEGAGGRDVELAARLGGARSRPVLRTARGEPPVLPVGAEHEADVLAERPAIDFQDVGGMDALKEEIGLKIIHPLRHPELYRAYGKRVGGGILLYGPPGCGKTHLARATAGEVDAAFISVGIHDVLDMYMGESERNLNHLFQQARDEAPCVLFFDEVDALAARRSDLRATGGRPQVNQFLAEMDGLDGANDGVLVLAATNAPWHLDPAFRRPGRFDRVLFVPPPDAAAREAILRVLLRGRPVAEVDAARVARKTEHFSGADLRAVVELAMEAKLADAIRAGRPLPVGTGDLLDAARRVRPSTREWFGTARNYVLYANEAGLYDDVRPFL